YSTVVETKVVIEAVAEALAVLVVSAEVLEVLVVLEEALAAVLANEKVLAVQEKRCWQYWEETCQKCLDEPSRSAYGTCVRTLRASAVAAYRGRGDSEPENVSERVLVP
ncbi:hypothetical protein D917_10374, partial [Trichinella nativa]